MAGDADQFVEIALEMAVFSGNESHKQSPFMKNAPVIMAGAFG
jgi:hypothetical protein